MFSRFQTIVNKMQANKPQLPYDDHERALKVLYGQRVGVAWCKRVDQAA
jgi:hypothetical protein